MKTKILKKKNIVGVLALVIMLMLTLSLAIVFSSMPVSTASAETAFSYQISDYAQTAAIGQTNAYSGVNSMVGKQVVYKKAQYTLEDASNNKLTVSDYLVEDNNPSKATVNGYWDDAHNKSGDLTTVQSTVSEADSYLKKNTVLGRQMDYFAVGNEGGGATNYQKARAWQAAMIQATAHTKLTDRSEGRPSSTNFVLVRLMEDWTATETPNEAKIVYSGVPEYNGKPTTFEVDANNSAVISGNQDPLLISGDQQENVIDNDAFSYGRLAIPNNTWVILDLNGHKLDRNLKLDAQNDGYQFCSVIVMGDNSRLDIFDSTAKKDEQGKVTCQGTITGGVGNLQTTSFGNVNKGGAVHVSSNSEVTLHSGSFIGNQCALGGAVYVVAHGTFNMIDGEIRGNKAYRGGAVYIALNSFGNFNMYGGVLSNNSAIDKTDNNGSSGGGVCVYQNAFMNMYGGAIVNNVSKNGGGIYVDKGSFVKLYGGEICDNGASVSGAGIDLLANASGVYVNGPVAIRNNFMVNVWWSGTVATKGADIPSEGVTHTSHRKKINVTIGSGEDTETLTDQDEPSNLFLQSSSTELPSGLKYAEIKVQGELFKNNLRADIYVSPGSGAAGDRNGRIMRGFVTDGYDDTHTKPSNTSAQTFPSQKNTLEQGKLTDSLTNTKYNYSAALEENVSPNAYFKTDNGADLLQRTYGSDQWIEICSLTESRYADIHWQYLDNSGAWKDISKDENGEKIDIGIEQNWTYDNIINWVTKVRLVYNKYNSVDANDKSNYTTMWQYIIEYDDDADTFKFSRKTYLKSGANDPKPENFTTPWEQDQLDGQTGNWMDVAVKYFSNKPEDEPEEKTFTNVDKIESKEAGVYTFTISENAKDGQLFTSADRIQTKDQSVEFTVSQIEVLVTGYEATKVYDGKASISQEQFAGGDHGLYGLRNEHQDKVRIASVSEVTLPSKDVGNYNLTDDEITIFLEDVDPSEKIARNYRISATDSNISVSVTPLTIEVVRSDSYVEKESRYEFSYNGLVQVPAFLHFMDEGKTDSDYYDNSTSGKKGFVETDDVTITYAGGQTHANADKDGKLLSGNQVYSATVTLTGTDAKNYLMKVSGSESEATESLNTTFVIKQVELKVSGWSLSNNSNVTWENISEGATEVVTSTENSAATATYYYNGYSPNSSYNSDNSIITIQFKGLQNNDVAPGASNLQLTFGLDATARNRSHPAAKGEEDFKITVKVDFNGGDKNGNYYIDSESATNQLEITLARRPIKIVVQQAAKELTAVYGTVTEKDKLDNTQGVYWAYAEGSLRILDADALSAMVVAAVNWAGSHEVGENKYPIPNEQPYPVVFAIQKAASADQDHSAYYDLTVTGGVGEHSDQGQYTITKAKIVFSGNSNQTFLYAEGTQHLFGVTSETVQFAGGITYEEAEVTYADFTHQVDESVESVPVAPTQDKPAQLEEIGVYTVKVTISADYHEQFEIELKLTISRDVVTITITEDYTLVYGTALPDSAALIEWLKTNSSISGTNENWEQLSDKLTVCVVAGSDQEPLNGIRSVGNYTISISVKDDYAANLTVTTGVSNINRIKVTPLPVEIQYLGDSFADTGELGSGPTDKKYINGDPSQGQWWWDDATIGGHRFRVFHLSYKGNPYNDNVNMWIPTVSNIVYGDTVKVSSWLLPYQGEGDPSLDEIQRAAKCYIKAALPANFNTVAFPRDAGWCLFKYGDENNGKLGGTSAFNYADPTDENNFWQLVYIEQADLPALDYENSSFVYNAGEQKPTITANGLLGSDKLELTYYLSSRLESPIFATQCVDVNSYTVKVTVVDGQDNHNCLSNYKNSDSLTLSYDFNITSAPITVSDVSVTERAYDGTTVAQITFEKSGVIDADSANVLFETSANFNAADVGEGLTVNFKIVISGDRAHNYKLMYVGDTNGDDNTVEATSKGTITKAYVAVAGIGIEDKVYDGTTNVVSAWQLEHLIWYVVDGEGNILSYTLYNSDSLALDKAKFVAVYRDKNVGTQCIVTISEMALAENGSYQNYRLRMPTEGIVNTSVQDVRQNGYCQNSIINAKVTKLHVKLDGNTFSIDNKEYNADQSAMVLYTNGVAKGITVTTALEGKPIPEGDNFVVTVSAHFGSANVGDYSTTASDPAKKITLTFTYGGDDNGNYEVEEYNGEETAKITPKQLTVNIQALNKVYDGNAYAQITVVLGNFAGGENEGFIKFDYEKLYANAELRPEFADKNVAQSKLVTFEFDYDKLLQAGIISDGDGHVGATGNYTAAKQTLASNADITPKQVKIATSATFNEKTYDGTTETVANTQATLDGVVLGDTVSVVVTEANYNSANVADADTISFIYRLNGADARNYSFEKSGERVETQAASIGGTITPLQVAVEWENVEFIYNGSVQNTKELAYYKDVNGDKHYLRVTLSGKTEFKDAGEYNFIVEKDEGVYKEYGVSGEMIDLNGNYKLKDDEDDSLTKTYTIAQAVLTLVGLAIVAKQYDGEDTCDVENVNWVEVNGGDESLIEKIKAVFKSTEVGTHEVTVWLKLDSNYRLEGGTLDESDYLGQNMFKTFVSGEIVPRQVDVVWTLPALTYNGQDQFDKISAKWTGAQSDGGELTVKITAYNTVAVDVAAQTTAKHAGLYAVTVGGLSEQHAKNYKLLNTDQTFAIGKAKVTVHGITAKDKELDGNTDAALDTSNVTFTVVDADGGTVQEGLYDGDLLTVIATGSFDDFAVGTHTVNIEAIALQGENLDYELNADHSQKTVENIQIYERNWIIDESYDTDGKGWKWVQNGNSWSVTLRIMQERNNDIKVILSESNGITVTLNVKTPATCTKDGTVYYTAVAVYGDAIFKYESGTEGYDEKNSTVPATGHNWGDWIVGPDGKTETRTCTKCEETETRQHVHSWFEEPTWQWNDNHSEATAIFTCTGCGHSEVVDAVVTSENKGDYTTYTAVVEFEGETYSVQSDIPNPVDESPQYGDFGSAVVSIGVQLLIMIVAGIVINRKNKQAR